MIEYGMIYQVTIWENNQIVEQVEAKGIDKAQAMSEAVKMLQIKGLKCQAVGKSIIMTESSQKVQVKRLSVDLQATE